MKKMIRAIAMLLLAVFLPAAFSACSASPNDMLEPMMNKLSNMDPDVPREKTEVSDEIAENPWVSAAEAPVSTFSADVDTASYTLFRKLVNSGYLLDGIGQRFSAAIRTEEMVNYFTYDYPQPAQGDLFGVKSTIARCPWDGESELLILGLASATAELPAVAGNNLVFLIDVSGSMDSADKLGLLKKTFSYLVDHLNEDDRVSIVTYSGREEVVLEGCPGSKKKEILNAINALKAEGVTNGQAGLEKAYATAQSNFISGGNNRIIMASDGDLNVGISSAEELKTFVSQKKETGVYLSVLGFGSGNYRDGNMEALADYGNGSYYYIDGESEAERIFSDKLLSTLFTVAEDVKLQLTFDPELVDSYRLVGYENRMLSEEDFSDDTKDAGELGEGHQLTVCYQLRLKKAPQETDPSAQIAKLAVRWKTPGYIEGKPETGASKLQETALTAAAWTDAPDGDFIFAASVAQLSLLLRNSPYLRKETSVAGILDALKQSNAAASNYWRGEFVSLLEKIK